MGNLRQARLECHQAAQLNTRAARAYVPAREDDSHTTLSWDHDLKALVGEAFVVGEKRLRLGVRLQDLTLLLLGDADSHAFELDGHTLSDAIEWLAGFGLEAEKLRQPLHFEMEDHPLFRWDPACAELAQLYRQAAEVLEEFRVKRNSKPVRCWPHHFDIATLAGSTGAGMSPGDSAFPDPYYYVTPWPYLPADRLPKLESKGKWHTEGWTGAVLTYEHFDDAAIRLFIDDAARKLIP